MDKRTKFTLDEDEIPTIYFWDVIFAKSVIEHLSTWKELPRKMSEVQYPHGWVWLATKNGDVVPTIERDHFVHIGWDELENIFVNNGYSIVKHYKDPLSNKGQILVAQRDE